MAGNVIEQSAACLGRIQKARSDATLWQVIVCGSLPKLGRGKESISRTDHSPLADKAWVYFPEPRLRQLPCSRPPRTHAADAAQLLPRFLANCLNTTAMIANEKILELHENGYCVLRAHLPKDTIKACREAFRPILLAYVKNHEHQPNRGPYRHFLPMPFEPRCFAPEFFFNEEVLRIVRGAMDRRIVADRLSFERTRSTTNPRTQPD